jgi:hypothetical protein
VASRPSLPVEPTGSSAHDKAARAASASEQIRDVFMLFLFYSLSFSFVSFIIPRGVSPASESSIHNFLVQKYEK